MYEIAEGSTQWCVNFQATGKCTGYNRTGQIGGPQHGVPTEEEHLLTLLLRERSQATGYSVAKTIDSMHSDSNRARMVKAYELYYLQPPPYAE